MESWKPVGVRNYWNWNNDNYPANIAPLSPTSDACCQDAGHDTQAEASA